MTPSPSATSHESRGKLRPAWRQWLIDTERGVTQGIRNDSTFCVYFFGGSVILATAFVLGLGVAQWAILILALTLVLSAQMFQQVLKVFWKEAARHLSAEARHALRIGTAAVTVTIVGSLATVAILFGERIAVLLQH